jgi:hypothetical protein
MAHYAYLDDDSIVTGVIVGKDEDEAPGNWETYYGAKRTSYNTRGGIHYDPVTGEPSEDQSHAFRMNYAGIGYSFRDDLNVPDGAFVPPQPYPSWILDEAICLWEAPVPYPNDGNVYTWDEATESWVPVDGGE